MKNTKSVNKFIVFAIIFSLLIGSATTKVFAATQEDIANIEIKIANVQTEIDNLSEKSKTKILAIKSEAQRQKDELDIRLNELPTDGVSEVDRNDLITQIDNLEGIINSVDSIDYSDSNTYSKFTNEVGELKLLTSKLQEFEALNKELDAAKKALETKEETSQETVKETIEETSKETIKESINETKKETPKETIKESVKETIIETVKDTPKETINETPKETIKENVSETSNDTIKENITEKFPVQDSSDNTNNDNNEKGKSTSKINKPIMVGSLLDKYQKTNDKQKESINEEAKNDNKSEMLSKGNKIEAKAKIDNPNTSDNFNMTFMLAILFISVISIFYIEKNKNKI